ncbi:MAG: cytochrome c [Saprospiraceae bacterium]
MDTGLQLKNLTNLIFAMLALLFLIMVSQCSMIMEEEEEELSELIDTVQPERPPEISIGMNLFKNNCASCHAKNMKADMTGPALANVEKRWNGNRENLRAWVRNSQAYLTTDDEYAKALALKSPSIMTAFPTLKDEEIDAILDYVKFVTN